MGILTDSLVSLRADENFKTWAPFFEAEMKKEYFKDLDNFITEEYNTKRIFPPLNDVFAAFKMPVDKCKVIIIGQDPYHGPNEAMGLAFSVRNGVKCPPSLRNIKKELVNDLGDGYATDDTDLTPWLNEGVFLINTMLTVRKDTPLSHNKVGWYEFTSAAIEFIAKNNPNPFCVLLWGSFAHTFEKIFTDRDDVYIIKSAHPSPLSAYRGFFNSNPFSRINDFLGMYEVEPINWKI